MRAKLYEVQCTDGERAWCIAGGDAPTAPRRSSGWCRVLACSRERPETSLSERSVCAQRVELIVERKWRGDKETRGLR